MTGAGALAWGLVTLAAACAPAAVHDRVAVETNDSRTITGRIVREAQDGSLLLEHDDGRYELLGPTDILGWTDDTTPPDAESSTAFGRRIVAELPPGFDLLVTKHYIVCFDTTRDYAKWCAALFERLYATFGTYWRHAELELVDPDRPLVVVIFASRQDYLAAATGDLGPAADRVAGYYNLLTNRVTTFDLTGSDRMAAKRGRIPGQVGAEILANPAAGGLISTLVHEATHQLAFNNGMHQRLAPVPLWVSEGLATYFETPSLQNDRGWRAVGIVNRPRLDHFLASYQKGCIERIVSGDDSFRDPARAVDSYAASWALCHHLLKVRKEAFVEYLRGMALKRPLDEDSPDTRLDEFRAAFGDPAAVEQVVVRSMARLASRPR